MAHIPDGLLSVPVLVAGAAVGMAGLAYALRGMDDRSIIRTGLLSAAFFAGSLISVPIGPSSVHLMLSGLMGLLLGPRIFAAVFVGLCLQVLLFGVGGITTLGINTVNIALPGLIFGMVARPAVLRGKSPKSAAVLAGAVGGLSVLGTAALVALCLAITGSEYVPVASIIAVTYVPLALVEAAITATVVAFLTRVEPAALK